MAMADYLWCAVCGCKAVYDADWYHRVDPDEHENPPVVEGLCSNHAKTHRLEAVRKDSRPTLLGPDDVVAFPSYEKAVQAAALLEKHRNSDPPCWGEVIEWPHQKGYAEDLERGSWKEYLPC